MSKPKPPKPLTSEEEAQVRERYSLATTDAMWCMDVRSLLATLDAERATRPDGLAWLVERGQSMGQVPTVWLDQSDEWTTDAWSARRFATREACEAFIEARSGFAIPSHGHRFGVAVQHGFAERAARPDGLREAAQAVVDTWNEVGPDNFGIGITKADAAIDALRAALSAPAPAPAPCPTCGAPTSGGTYAASLAPEWKAEMEQVYRDGLAAAAPAPAPALDEVCAADDPYCPHVESTVVKDGKTTRYHRREQAAPAPALDRKRLERALDAVPGEWDEYTPQRLADAIADAYEAEPVAGRAYHPDDALVYPVDKEENR